MYRLPLFILCFKTCMREVTQCTLSEIKEMYSSLQRLIKIEARLGCYSHILNFSTEPRSFLLDKTVCSNTVIHSKEQICSCPVHIPYSKTAATS